MKGAIRGLKIMNYLWLVIVFLILIFAALPIIPGMVVVKTPGPDGWTTTITNDTVTISGNASIRNGGFFPFNNFYFVIKLYDTNGTDLASFSSTPINLLPGLWMDVPIILSVNKTEISSSVLDALLHSEVTFGSLVYFNMNYLFDFRIQAGFKANMTVGPLIKDLFVDWHNTTISTNGTNYEISVPYSFSTKGLMTGTQINVSGSISNDTQELGSVSSSVTLSQHVQSELHIQLSQEAYDHLSTSPDHLVLDLTIDLNGTTWSVERGYDWVPPEAGGG